MSKCARFSGGGTDILVCVQRTTHTPVHVFSGTDIPVCHLLPGLGRLTVDAVLKRDYPIVQGLILVFAAAKVIVNLIIDISYAFLDPRIRY